MFCRSLVREEEILLYPTTRDKNSQNRFSSILGRVMEEASSEDLLILGCERSDIAPYSCRKGAATYATGQVITPNAYAIQLRMGHSLGKVNDAYIFGGDGADQLLGRFCAGLPFLDERFAVLPPHFSCKGLSLLTVADWEHLIPGSSSYPVETKAIFPYLLAQVLYHETFLRSNLDPLHPIFSCRIFSDFSKLEQLKSEVLLGELYCHDTGMEATGVPPHILECIRSKRSSEEIRAFSNMMQGELSEISSNLPTAVAEVVVQRVRENFSIEGVLPVTLNDLTELRSYMSNMVREEVTRITPAVENDNPVPSGIRGGQEWWRQWNWQDGLLDHPVPKNWRFPSSVTVKNMWDLWFFGHYGDGIRPYRYLHRNHDLSVKTDRKMFTAAKVVIENMKNKIVSMNTALDNRYFMVSMTRVESDSLFFAAYDTFISEVYLLAQRECVRRDDVCYNTVYNVLTARKN